MDRAKVFANTFARHNDSVCLLQRYSDGFVLWLAVSPATFEKFEGLVKTSNDFEFVESARSDDELGGVVIFNMEDAIMPMFLDFVGQILHAMTGSDVDVEIGDKRQSDYHEIDHAVALYRKILDK